MLKLPTHLTVLVAWTFGTCFLGHAASPAVRLQLIGDWEIAVELVTGSPAAGEASGTIKTTLRVPPPKPVVIAAEQYATLPLFNTNAPGWVKGAQLKGVRAQETTTPFLLHPDSLVLCGGPTTDAKTFHLGEDYNADSGWGTIGRLPGGQIKEGQPVFASYQYTPLRLDAIVLTRAGRIVLRSGEARAAAPLPTAIRAGEQRLANIWLPGPLAKLGPEHLFPVLETAYPEPAKPTPSVAEKLLPKTIGKLRSGEKLRVLAWGDSVTVGTYLPDWERNRWRRSLWPGCASVFPRRTSN